jgi:hypothetical protein
MLLFQRYVSKYWCHRILTREKQFFIYGATAYPQVTQYLVELFGSICGIAGVSVEEEYVSGSLEHKKLHHLVDTEKWKDICPLYYLCLHTMFGMMKFELYLMVL